MSKTSNFRWHPVLVRLLLVGMGWSLWGIFAARPAEAQTLTGVQGDRTRITLGFQVKPEAVQAWLPSPWQLHPLDSGPLKGANLLVVFVDRLRDDDPEGKPKSSATKTNRIIPFLAPAKHPQTGQTASLVFGEFVSNPAQVPGFYKVFRAATVRVEHTIKSQDVEAEEVTDVWEVRDATGTGGIEFRLQSLRQVGTRTRDKGEPNIISAQDPALWRIYKFDAATDVVKSVPEGIDRVQGYTFRLTVPEYSKLFDGSEQLIGISVTPWYVRQVFVR
jgi:hypothetical protein